MSILVFSSVIWLLSPDHPAPGAPPHCRDERAHFKRVRRAIERCFTPWRDPTQWAHAPDEAQINDCRETVSVLPTAAQTLHACRYGTRHSNQVASKRGFAVVDGAGPCIHEANHRANALAGVETCVDEWTSFASEDIVPPVAPCDGRLTAFFDRSTEYRACLDRERKVQ